MNLQRQNLSLLHQSFPSKAWLEFSAPLFLGCSTVLLAGEGRNFSHHPLWAGAFLETISGSRVVLWEWEADHQFLGMETVGKAFLIKTPILEASAEADTRP